MEKVIELAREQGWKGNLPMFVVNTTFVKNPDLLDPEFWKAVCEGLGFTGEKIRMCTGCGVSLRNNENPTMDGKHGGKNGCGSDIYQYEGQWLVEMHRFVDNLAEGKFTTEQFFEGLLFAKK